MNEEKSEFANALYKLGKVAILKFPEFRKLSQDKIEKYSKELVEKAIIN